MREYFEVPVDQYAAFFLTEWKPHAILSISLFPRFSVVLTYEVLRQMINDNICL